MEKTIFILREVEWCSDTKSVPYYLGANDIYRKFPTYEAALAKKNQLQVNMARYHNANNSFKCNINFASADYFEIMLKKGLYGYFRDVFGIDWKGIKESGLIDESKLKSGEFNELVNNFIRKKVLQNDTNILFVLEMIELNFYELSEVKESDCLYKIYSNASFTDFPLLAECEDEITGTEVKIEYYDFVFCIYFDNQEKIQTEINQRFNDLLRENALKGSFSDLSEAPETLRNYIENYPKYFVYDAQKELFSMKKQAPDDIMRDFVELLRPEKVPFIIKSFPISEIPETYNQRRRVPLTNRYFPASKIPDKYAEINAAETEAELIRKVEILQKMRLDRLKRFEARQDDYLPY